MRRRLFGLALVLALWACPADAAISAVSGQEASSAGNDVTLTLPSPVAVGNYVYILTSMTIESETLSITGTTMSFSTVIGPVDSPGQVMRQYIFCAQGDGVDNTFTVTSSGAQNALSFAKEFSGVSGCTAEDTEGALDDTEVTGNPFDLDETGTPLACSSGALVVGVVHATTGTTWTPTSSATGIATQQTAGTSAWASWRVVAGAGNYDTTWTANSNETAVLTGACFAASGGTLHRSGLATLGVH